MLELTGFGSVLRGIGFLYWALAIGAVVLAVKYSKGVLGKVIATTIVLAAFGYLPGKAMVEQHQRDTYAKAAWAYFKMKCDTEAGEKIYKMFTGVKSVLIVKPLPPATEADSRDQFWMGDPYSASIHSQRGKLEAARFASPNAPIAYGANGPGLDFVELTIPADSRETQRFVKYIYPSGKREYVQQPIDKPSSRFGISWEDISSREDRKYWIAGGRLRVIDLENGSVIAERTGYLIEAGFGSTSGGRSPWLTARGIGPNGRSCPETHDWSDRWFVLKVLNPATEKQNGK